MPEITKSGANLHLFIVTHKYTDLYFIFFFQQPTLGRQADLGLRLYNRPSAVAITHRIAHPHRPPSSSACPIGAIHRHRRKNRRRAVSYVSTGLACLPRDTNASPIYRRRAVVETSSLGLHSLVAERRHSSVTRYAKRSVACRDSPLHQPLRAGGTPLPRLRRLPLTSSAIIIGLRIHIIRHHHLIAPTAQYTAIGRNRRRAV